MLHTFLWSQTGLILLLLNTQIINYTNEVIMTISLLLALGQKTNRVHRSKSYCTFQTEKMSQHFTES